MLKNILILYPQSERPIAELLGILILVDIVIYTTAFCPFCYRAKSLLDSKGVVYKEIDVTMNATKRREMSQLAGSTSVPQVFVDGEHIGDCDGIHMLEHKGILDQNLGIAG